MCLHPDDRPTDGHGLHLLHRPTQVRLSPDDQVFDRDSGPVLRHNFVTVTRGRDVDLGNNTDTVNTTRRDPGFRRPVGEPEPLTEEF